MKCPHCGTIDNRVVDSRMIRDGRAIRRRRACNTCERRFTTYERVEESVPLVVKKGGRREIFDRAKVLKGLKRACEKRTIGGDELDQLVDDLERELIESGEREIDSSFIGEQVMAHLRELDEVAYVRFASVYRSFKDIDEFMLELSTLLRQRRRTDPNESA